MNKVNLIGRLTKDPDLRYTQAGKGVASFTLAVNRFKKDDGTDFIKCTCWGTTAENLVKYQGKGSQIAVSGRIRTGSYNDKDGKKVYTTEVVAEEIEYLGSKKDNQSNNDSNQDYGVQLDDFHPIDDNDDDLPF